jgi:hypothetical protein
MGDAGASEGYEVSAVLHVHTRWSDGSGTVRDVVAAAEEAGVDVLWVTDHDTLAARRTPGPGRYGRTLLLVGAEVTPPENHLLAFGIEEVPAKTLPWAAIVQAVADQGGLAVVAHPDDPGNPWLRLPSYRWTERTVREIHGLEIWNHLSQWMRGIRSFRTALGALRDPWFGAALPEPATLRLWDQLGIERPVLAVGGVDAHAVRLGLGRAAVTVMPYRTVFHTIRTHILLPERLTGDAAADERALVAALAARRALVVSWQAGDERGVRFWGEVRRGIVPMGAEVPWEPGLTLHGVSPVPVAFRVIRNGVVERELQGTGVTVPCEGPGVFRLELWREHGRNAAVPWVLTNAIYVRPPS